MTGETMKWMTWLWTRLANERGEVAVGGPATLQPEVQEKLAKLDKPLAAFREYIVHLKALFAGGAVDLHGAHYATQAKIERAVDAPVMASEMTAPWPTRSKGLLAVERKSAQRAIWPMAPGLGMV